MDIQGLFDLSNVMTEQTKKSMIKGHLTDQMKKGAVLLQDDYSAAHGGDTKKSMSAAVKRVKDQTNENYEKYVQKAKEDGFRPVSKHQYFKKQFKECNESVDDTTLDNLVSNLLEENYDAIVADEEYLSITEQTKKSMITKNLERNANDDSHSDAYKKAAQATLGDRQKRKEYIKDQKNRADQGYEKHVKEAESKGYKPLSKHAFYKQRFKESFLNMCDSDEEAEQLVESFACDLMEENYDELLACIDAYTESLDPIDEFHKEFTESFIPTLTEEYNAIMTSPDSTEEEITEATTLAKHVHGLAKRENQLRKNLDKLYELSRNTDPDSADGKSIKKTVDNITSELNKMLSDVKEFPYQFFPRSWNDLDSIGAKHIHGGDNNGKTGIAGNFAKYNQLSRYDARPTKKKEREPGELAKSNSKLKKMTESFDLMIEASDVNIPVPGGLSERPSGQPADKSIPIPKGTEITQDQYNSAITALQKSFKEGAELLEQLQSMTIVQETVEDRQEDYVEAALDEAILAAYENGPIFEAVKRSDKTEIKKIVNNIRSKINDCLDGEKVKFCMPKSIAKFIRGEMMSTYLWQVAGVIMVEGGSIASIISSLNDKLSSDLGEYKLLKSKVPDTIIGEICKKFGWQHVRQSYFLIVDKKLPDGLKKAQAAVHTESVENFEDAMFEWFNDEFDDDEFMDIVEASTKKTWKSEVAPKIADISDKKDVRSKWKTAKKGINQAYDDYKEEEKSQGRKPKSKKEWYADLTDDSFVTNYANGHVDKDGKLK